jgi:4-amino-4-deoxy-L-arabinose transferase-like glycosyltransferase
VTARRWLWPLGLGAVLLLAATLRFLWLDRLPPGLHYDEAAYGMQALDLRAKPRFELFFPAFTGHEPLFVYLLSSATTLLGESTWAIRATSASVGVLAVLATALAGRGLFGPAVGLLAAGLLGASFWHMMFTRQVHRLSLLVALAPLAVWLLWRARERPNAPRALLAGSALGALAYTYVTARLLLLGLGLFLLVELLVARRERRWLALAVGLTALTVAAPLALYFVRHPDQFSVRFSQTAGSDPLRSVLDTLAMYGLRGDVQPKFNLPGRPALDVGLAALFALGMLTSLARLGEARSRVLILWWLGGIAAGFLTVDTPNFGRLNPAAPPSYLLAARGAATLGHVAAPRLAMRPPAAALLAVALVAGEAALSARAYFLRWAPSAETYYALHGDLADLGRLARAQPADVQLYAASEHYRHPTVHYVAGGEAFARLRWFDGRYALVLPPQGQPARYLVPASARPPDLDAVGQPVEVRLDPSGHPAVELRPGGDAPIGFAQPVGVRFSPTDDPGRAWAELLGVDRPAPIQTGDQLVVRTVWRLLVDRPPRTPDFFAHALERGRRWGQRDVSPYLASEWRAGETAIVWLGVPIDRLAPAGDYTLRIGLNDPVAGRALEGRRADGSVLPDGVELPSVAVAHQRAPVDPVDVGRLGPGTVPDTRAAAGTPVDLGPLRLVAAIYPPSLEVGRGAWVDLLWVAAEPPGGIATLLLRNPSGERVLDRRDVATLDPHAPWRTGELQRDARLLSPTRAEAGRWELIVTLGATEHVLGEVEVIAPTARFDAPTPRVSLDADLVGAARLLGLDARPDGVTLYWRAVGPASANYAVFVHALGADGRIVAQHDGQPAAGTRPARAWQADEVIVDDHPLRRPPETVALAIGLYDPATGQRVPLSGGGDHIRVQADNLST